MSDWFTTTVRGLVAIGVASFATIMVLLAASIPKVALTLIGIGAASYLLGTALDMVATYGGQNR